MYGQEEILLPLQISIQFISRLDKQGSIEENVLFVNRDFGFDIDDMLGAIGGGYASDRAPE